MKTIALLSLVAAFGCVQATVSDSVSKTTEVQIANPYPQLSSVGIPSTTLPPQSVSVDISGTLADLNKIGAISLTVNKNDVQSQTGDFSFIDELKITLSPDTNNTSGLPELIILDVQLTQDQKASSTLSLLPSADGNTLYSYFSSGGLNMNFTFTVSGHVPTQGLDIIDTLDVSVSAQVNKSINDIGQ